MSTVVCSFKNNQNTRRKEVIEHPKYVLITSNTMRKYVTSKQYRKIKTELSINIIENTKESTFLSYIRPH